MKLTAPDGGNVFIGPHVLLPTDKARHVGEAVAMVVAETLPQALDAAEAVEVDYEPLPFVTDPAAAIAARRAAAFGTRSRTISASKPGSATRKRPSALSPRAATSST